MALRTEIKEWLKKYDKQCDLSDLNIDDPALRRYNNPRLCHRLFVDYVKTNKVTRACQKCGNKFTPIVGNQKNCDIHKWSG